MAFFKKLKITKSPAKLRDIIILVSLGTVSMALVFYLLQKWNTSVSRRLAKTRAELETLNRREANLTQLVSDYQAVAGNLDRLDPLLPDETNLSVFLNYLDRLAGLSGVKTKIVFKESAISQTPLPSTSSPSTIAASQSQPPFITFNLTVEGPGANIASLVDKLESGPFFIEFNQASIEAKPSIETSAVFSSEVKLFTNDPFRPVD